MIVESSPPFRAAPPLPPPRDLRRGGVATDALGAVMTDGRPAPPLRPPDPSAIEQPQSKFRNAPAIPVVRPAAVGLSATAATAGVAVATVSDRPLPKYEEVLSLGSSTTNSVISLTSQAPQHVVSTHQSPSTAPVLSSGLPPPPTTLPPPVVKPLINQKSGDREEELVDHLKIQKVPTHSSVVINDIDNQQRFEERRGQATSKSNITCSSSNNNINNNAEDHGAFLDPAGRSSSIMSVLAAAAGGRETASGSFCPGPTPIAVMEGAQDHHPSLQHQHLQGSNLRSDSWASMASATAGNSAHNQHLLPIQPAPPVQHRGSFVLLTSKPGTLQTINPTTHTRSSNKSPPVTHPPPQLLAANSSSITAVIPPRLTPTVVLSSKTISFHSKHPQQRREIHSAVPETVPLQPSVDTSFVAVSNKNVLRSDNVQRYLIDDRHSYHLPPSYDSHLHLLHSAAHKSVHLPPPDYDWSTDASTVRKAFKERQHQIKLLAERFTAVTRVEATSHSSTTTDNVSADTAGVVQVCNDGMIFDPFHASFVAADGRPSDIGRSLTSPSMRYPTLNCAIDTESKFFHRGREQYNAYIDYLDGVLGTSEAVKAALHQYHELAR